MAIVGGHNIEDLEQKNAPLWWQKRGPHLHGQRVWGEDPHGAYGQVARLASSEAGVLRRLQQRRHLLRDAGQGLDRHPMKFWIVFGVFVAAQIVSRLQAQAAQRNTPVIGGCQGCR